MMGSARASAVVEFLRINSGIKPGRLVVVSYSSYRPISTNKTREGRASNRRIEIVLLNLEAYEIVKKNNKIK